MHNAQTKNSNMHSGQMVTDREMDKERYYSNIKSIICFILFL